jgi:hypothetical protein
MVPLPATRTRRGAAGGLMSYAPKISDLFGRAGGQHVIVPGGPPMHLTATGAEQRRALVLILHEASKPATTLVRDWTPKGLCR